mmetsp:Transcript_13918/g.14089  ORF Transcript_13918/g.14089 Transcript_13918/m.14089 type:complete len:171 (-) Transcript_13918:671-1183(-)
MKRFGILFSFIIVSASSLSIAPRSRSCLFVAVCGPKFRSSDNFRAVRHILEMSSSQEDSSSDTNNPAVLDRPNPEKEAERLYLNERDKIGNEGWEVRIYNDGDNTREFVARCLVKVASLTEVDAYHTMMHAHQNGVAVVGQWEYERAELYNEALKKRGIVSDLNPVDKEK